MAKYNIKPALYPEDITGQSWGSAQQAKVHSQSVAASLCR